MEIKPLGEHLLVKKDDVAEMTESGRLFYPESTQRSEKVMTATVRAVGPGRRLKNGQRAPIGVEPGDSVLVEKFMGKITRIGDEELHILTPQHVLGIIEK